MHHFESCKAADISATLLFSFKALEKVLIVGLGLGATSHLQPRPSTRSCHWAGEEMLLLAPPAQESSTGRVFVVQGVQGFPFLPKWQRGFLQTFKGSPSRIGKSGRGNRANTSWHNHWYPHYTRTSNPAFKGNYSTSTAGLISYLT